MLDRPVPLILIGLVLVLTGMVLPYLMVIQVVPSTLFLNFLSYTASVVGLFLGIIGAASLVKVNRRPK